MKYFNNTWQILDNYVIARWQNRPSTASFWYLPEPANIRTEQDLIHYQKSKGSPLYLINYCHKLQYAFINSNDIIVLSYPNGIGAQINPEAAFQYALGLHDHFILTQDENYLNKFWHYVHYFFSQQTAQGLWGYNFNWYGSKAPWYSALAQARGASVMLRAWLLSKDERYLNAAKQAVSKFTHPINKGGFLHLSPHADCWYFEEYPQTPTGVINGFMAALMCIWELKFWIGERSFVDLWDLGLRSLIIMLPYYTTRWWSLYDLDQQSPIANVNSPRYHHLEIEYLNVLSILSESAEIQNAHKKRIQQSQRAFAPLCATGLKLARKILYK